MIRPAEMSDDQFQEQAIAHLLGELDVSAEIPFQEELAARAAPGQAVLRELRETLGDLALAVEPAEPPHALRARVLWSVGAPVRQADSPPASTHSFWAWASAALAAAVAVGLGVWAARLADERDELRSSMAGLEQRLAADDSAAGRAATLGGDLDFVGAAAAVREIRAVGDVAEASARLFVDDDGRALLLARGLPSLPPGRVYALWVTRGGETEQAGVFRPDAEGRGRVAIADLDPGPADVFAITEEPAAISERPTGSVLLQSSR